MSQLGVRYVYYSPYNYNHSRKLAARMGLETGWNTAVSLADEHDGRCGPPIFSVDDKLQWEAFAQLPHGIAQIRERLVTQDNIPLLVHLFTHA